MKSRKLGLLLAGAAQIALWGAAQAHAQTPAKANTDKGAAVVDEVVVTGTRASLRKAQAMKRDAPNVIEAVTPTDLGQFDDVNLADVLQRVPAVQVERDDAGTDGDRVSIRGIGSNFVVTTFAGRTPMSSGSEGQRNIRSFNFNTVPSELVNGLIVAKTPTADAVEQGLAGSIDIQILTPLAARYAKGKNSFATVEGRVTYSDLAGDARPRFSAVFGGRNKAKDMAYYVNVLHSEQSTPTYQVQNRDGYTPGGTAGRATFTVDANNNGIYDNGDIRYTNGVNPCTTAPAITGVPVITSGPGANNAVACDNTKFDIFNGILANVKLDKIEKRDAFAIGGEWAFNDHWNFTADYQHTEVRNEATRYSIATALNSGGGTSGAVPVNNVTAFFKPNAVFIQDTGGPTTLPFIRGWDGTGLIGYLGSEGAGTVDSNAATNTNYRDVLSLTSSAGNFSNTTKTDMIGATVRYTAGRLTNRTDLSASRNQYWQSFTQVDIRQRYRNAFTLGDVGFDIVNGYPVVTNIANLNVAALPTYTDVFNSASCATRICAEYWNTGSLQLGTTPAAQFTNAYNQLIGLGGQSARRRETRFDGTNYALRSDFHYDVGDGFLRGLIFGGRYSVSDVDSVTSVVRRYAGNPRSTIFGANCTANDGVACIAAGQIAFVNATTTVNGAPSTMVVGAGTPAEQTILKINQYGACDQMPGYCTDTLANGGLIKRPNASFYYREAISAGYLGTEFEADNFWIPFTGNLGVRLAYTDWKAKAGNVSNYNIVIPTTGGGPVVVQCKNTAQASLVPGACNTLPVGAGAKTINTLTGTMAANGAFSAGSTSPLTKGLTSEGDVFLDEIYFNLAPGSLRNPYGVAAAGHYLDVLPSINLNFRVLRDLRARLGVSRVVARPDPFQISPVASVSLSDTDAYEQGIASAIVAEMNKGLSYDAAVKADSVKTALAQTSANIITAGNPDIKPYRATNYDVTLEYYTPNDGSFVVSAFYKDVKGFILQRLQDDIVYVPGYTFDSTADANTLALNGKPIPFRVQKYINYSDAKVYGFEVGGNQPLTFLPGVFRHLGVTGNYTYVDSSFALDVGNYGYGFPGSSKHNVNAIVYYETSKLDVRLAYNYRSAYVRALAGSGSQSNLTRFTNGQERLDATVTLKATKNLQLRLNATNLTGSDRWDYSATPLAVMDRFAGERTYTLSARYRY